MILKYKPRTTEEITKYLIQKGSLIFEPFMEIINPRTSEGIALDSSPRAI